MFFIKKIIVNVQSFTALIEPLIVEVRKSCPMYGLTNREIILLIISRLIEDIYTTTVNGFNRNDSVASHCYYSVKQFWPGMEAEFSSCIIGAVPFKIVSSNISLNYNGLDLLINNNWH